MQTGATNERWHVRWSSAGNQQAKEEEKREVEQRHS
jgi:hypothetical protein